MQISSGLIIADPWIGLILEGSKSWEMRSTPTSHRGWFGLIKKGSGEVWGIARLVDCGSALSKAELLATTNKHRIPEQMIQSGAVAKWVIPWEIADVIRFKNPIPYKHRSGAVTWVRFDSDVQDSLKEKILVGKQRTQLDRPNTATKELISIKEPTTLVASDHAANSRRPILKSTELPPANGHIIGKSKITVGNIRNNHFYLTGFLDQFPDDAIGGSNKGSRAAREIAIEWGGQTTVFSDIDGTKRLFRSRKWVKGFFDASNAEAGDEVVVLSVAPYSIRVRIEKQICN